MALLLGVSDFRIIINTDNFGIFIFGVPMIVQVQSI